MTFRASQMLPYVAEFLGTLILVGSIFIIASTTTSIFWIASLSAVALFIGICVSMHLRGPGYLNPAVAIMLSDKQNKSSSWLGGMIFAELLAVVLVLGVWFFITERINRKLT